jgi:hypothetical protein
LLRRAHDDRAVAAGARALSNRRRLGFGVPVREPGVLDHQHDVCAVPAERGGLRRDPRPTDDDRVHFSALRVRQRTRRGDCLECDLAQIAGARLRVCQDVRHAVRVIG